MTKTIIDEYETVMKLSRLIKLCKCGVYLTVNEHRDVYMTASDAIDEFETRDTTVDPEVRQKMIETDSIIELQFYPDTPIGSFTVLHYDLDSAIDEALGLVQKKSLGDK